MLFNTPRIIWCFLVVGLALRLLVIQWTSGIELILDEVNYVDYGRHLLANGFLPNAFRPPLYPSLIALSELIGGPSATAVRMVQAIISSAAGLVLFQWLKAHVGQRGASLSCAVWCFYPVLIGYTHLLWTETVFLSMIVFFLATAMPDHSLSMRRTFSAGLLFGLTALTRSVVTPVFWLAPLFVLLHPSRWAWRPKPGLRTLIFLAGFALTIAPWAAHNVVVEGRLVVMETTNGYNLWKGNTPWEHPFATEAPQYPGPVVSIPMFPYEGSGPRLTSFCEEKHASSEPFDRWHLSQCARSMAFDFIAEEPFAFIQRGFTKLGHAFHPSNLLQRHLHLNLYGEWSPFLSNLMIWGTSLSYFALIVLSIFALIRAPRSPMTGLLVGLGAYQMAIIFITFGNTRFRLLILLMGIILAAWIPKPHVESR